jgi:hypothetical protein
MYKATRASGAPYHQYADAPALFLYKYSAMQALKTQAAGSAYIAKFIMLD